MDIKNIVHHPSWEFSSEVRAKCSSLFQNFGINYFDYAKFYYDGGIVLLFSDRAWVEHFLTDFAYVLPPNVLSPGLHLWESYIEESLICDASNQFNHCYGLTIISANKDHYEIINFSAPKNNRKILDIYLNQLDILAEFKKIFLKDAEPLLRIAEKNSLFSQQKLLLPKNNDEKSFNDLIGNRVSVFSGSNARPISDSICNLYGFTGREKECFALLASGFTAKGIARRLSISFRTVEKHIDNLKKKSNCRTKFDLIKILEK